MHTSVNCRRLAVTADKIRIDILKAGNREKQQIQPKCRLNQHFAALVEWHSTVNRVGFL